MYATRPQIVHLRAASTHRRGFGVIDGKRRFVTESKFG